MSFKLWLEIVELRKPSNKVSRRIVVKDKGTNVARRVIEYAYKTKLGNTVKLKFEPKGGDHYDIIFYVNDVLYDYGSRFMGTSRDAEILPTVFYLIKEKANRLKAKVLSFHATKSERDTKTVRNIPIEPYKKVAMEYLERFAKDLKSYETKMVKPNPSVYIKLGKPIPPDRPDVDKDYWFKWLSGVLTDIDGHLDDLRNKAGLGQLPFPYIPTLINHLQKLSDVVKSHSETGFVRTSNRRANIYKRILDRYFANEWDIDISGINFVLTRQ